MKHKLFLLITGCFGMAWLVFSCHTSNPSNENQSKSASPPVQTYGGFSSQVEWGRHLVAISGCGDCHTPKIMTPQGPVPDTTMFLAGHPAGIPAPAINRREIEQKGFMLTNDLSVWIGPWGISYAANLTPDETGLGTWTEQQFLTAIRKGRWMGVENGRPFLPPMSFVAEGMNRSFSDNELKAIFAYLKTIRPVHNVVPAPVPPLASSSHG